VIVSFSTTYLAEVVAIAQQIDAVALEAMAQGLKALRTRGGRLFILGVGGSAGNAGHAVNDFRKLCGIECYAPTDNVPELTARTNDEGWETVFASYLETSRATAADGILVFSVGGGDAERGVSVNIVRAVDLAQQRGMTVFGIVGRAEGHTARNGDFVITVPVVAPERITPHSEAFQAVLWHALVSHPDLQLIATKW
jgi:D-sedoheptulose 7-phosphate isomerase